MRARCQLGWILASKIHQNLLLDGSWAVLWRSWAVLGRLGGLLRRLEEASKNDAKKKVHKKSAKIGFRRRLGGLLAASWVDLRKKSAGTRVSTMASADARRALFCLAKAG